MRVCGVAEFAEVFHARTHFKMPKSTLGWIDLHFCDFADRMCLEFLMYPRWGGGESNQAVVVVGGGQQ